MIDLAITHLIHPWGPPWTLATLGDMLENDQFSPKWLGEMSYNQIDHI